MFSLSSSRPISTKLDTKVPLIKGNQICSKERPCLLPRRDNNEIMKIHWHVWNLFSPEPQGHFQPYLTKSILGCWGFKFVQMKGHDPFQGEINLHWLHLKFFFSRTTGPISTKLGSKPPWMKRIEICSKWMGMPFSKGMQLCNSKYTLTITRPISCKSLSKEI